jgi:mannosyltransferase OCH1-like enzyme
LKDCIELVNSKQASIYKHLTTRNWTKKNLSSKVGQLTALSDAFRFYLLNKYGGIYLDLDTFPVKPFDDKLLSYENGFTVNYRPNRYDIFFVGMNKDCVDYGLVRLPNDKNEKWFDEKVHRILYYEKIWQRIYESHCQDIKCKFFNCLLQIGECMYNSKLVPQYYVDHFRKEAWR